MSKEGKIIVGTIVFFTVVGIILTVATIVASVNFVLNSTPEDYDSKGYPKLDPFGMPWAIDPSKSGDTGGFVVPFVPPG